MACILVTNLLDGVALRQRAKHRRQYFCSNRWLLCAALNYVTPLGAQFKPLVSFYVVLLDTFRILKISAVSECLCVVTCIRVTQALWTNCLYDRKHTALLALFMHSHGTQRLLFKVEEGKKKKPSLFSCWGLCTDRQILYFYCIFFFTLISMQN